MSAEALSVLAELAEIHRQSKDLISEIARLDSSDLPIVERRQRIQSLSDELIHLHDQTREKATALLKLIPPELKINRFFTLERCSARARAALQSAGTISASRGQIEITPHVILEALANDTGTISGILRTAGHYEPTTKSISLERSAGDAELVETSEAIRQVVYQAVAEAEFLKHEVIEPEHLLLALMQLNPELVSDAQKVRTAILNLLRHGP